MFYEKPPQRNLLPVLGKVKSVYLLWHSVHIILPQSHRYTLGNRIDLLLIELIEAVSSAAFLSKNEKIAYVRLAIRKLDALQVLLLVLWETKSIDNKKYLALSAPLDEIGKMLVGWNGQLSKTLELARDKQNSPAEAREK